MFCPRCGRAVNAEANFCGGCGLSKAEIERYLKSLSKIQRKIIEMKMQNVEVQHIKEELGLTDSQYSSHMEEVVQYEHIRLLHI